MTPAELARRLRDIEDAVTTLRADAEHDSMWRTAVAEIDTPRPNFANLLPEEGDEKPLTMRDLDPEAAFVEQIEVFHHDVKPEYHVRFRYDDDTTEKLGIFSLYEPAIEYAREQARRYHIPIFDSTYEELVD